MIEITPEVFTLIGIKVLLPPICFLPAIFAEYCTGSLLSPSFKYTINTNTIKRTTRIPATVPTPFAPEPAAISYILFAATGKLETMLIKIIIEEPFPIPFAVICSANHIIKVEPAISVMTELA